MTPTTTRPNRAELMTQSGGRVQPASQATHIEQSRAVAQVQGALIVAQQRPRNELLAAERIREACRNRRLAERAFFSYRRGGENVTGPSIHFARELARCWANVEYGITELSRSEGESEMLAYAWDLESNARVTNSFIVPHRRDSKSGSRELTEQRDVYENNSNNAARRLRECILSVIPRGLRDEAEDICRETLEDGGGEPIEERRRKLAEAYAAIGVTPMQIMRRVGRPVDRLTAFDVSQLGIDYRSIKRGEVAATELFQSDVGETATRDLRTQAAAATAPEVEPEVPAEPKTEPEAPPPLPPEPPKEAPRQNVEDPTDPLRVKGLNANAAVATIELAIKQANPREADRLWTIYKPTLAATATRSPKIENIIVKLDELVANKIGAQDEPEPEDE